MELVNQVNTENTELKGADTADESFDQIDLKIDKEEIITKDDFYSNPNVINKKIKNIRVQYRYKKVGNTLTLWYNKEGNPLILIGPHWPFYLCLSSVISFICYLYFTTLWNYLNPVVRYVGIGIYMVQILSYTYTFLKNPGLPTIDAKPEDIHSTRGVDFCAHCHIFINKDKKVKHCHDCDICIEGYDHHCPWTSKCVGEGNLYGFYLFVASTMILFAYLIFGVSVSKIR